jgi:hypothetical protein
MMTQRRDRLPRAYRIQRRSPGVSDGTTVRGRNLTNMPRAKSDVANVALRTFLQDMGAAYDQERG